MTKVTYNMYSCAISGMSREMMKMDGRDSAECQNWEKKNIKVILEIVSMRIMQKMISDRLLHIEMRTKKREKQREIDSSSRNAELEREGPPSL